MVDWTNDREAMANQLSILAAAIEIEKFGHDFYMRMSGCIKDKNGSIILKSLAGDEEQHQKWIERQIDRIQPGKDPSKISPDPRFASLIPKAVFPEPKNGCLTLEDEIKGVEIGIGVEKNSIKLYSELAQGTKDMEMKQVMFRLSKWEEGHLKILEDNLHYLKRGGSWYGYSPILDG